MGSHPPLSSRRVPCSSFGAMAIYETLASLPGPRVPEHLLKWTPGVTPISTWTEVISSLVLYLAVIFGGQWFMRDRKAVQLKPLFMVHNALLSAASGLVLALMLEEVRVFFFFCRRLMHLAEASAHSCL